MHDFYSDTYTSEYFGGTLTQGVGDPFGHKTPNFWDIKLQIFGTENFEKFWVFKEKSAIFGV